MRVWIDPNDLTWFLAWTLRGHSFCPRKVIDPILFDPFLAQAFRMTCVWLDWSYFMSILSENDRDSFLCTASFFVKVLFSLIGDVYIVLDGGPEVAAQVTLARRWSTHQTQIAQAHTGTSWKDNKRYHSRWGITVSPWWVPCFRKTCGNALGLEPDLSSTQSQDPSWLCPGV